MVEKNTKTEEARQMVKKYMLIVLGVGLLPFPLVDVVAISGIQLKMLHGLAKLYDIEFVKHRGKSLIASLLGGGATVSLSYNVASVTKSVPVFGQVTGMVSTSLLAGASTYAIGQVFIQHFESGGTFLNFDPQKVREHYLQHMEDGKAEIKKSFAGIKP